MNDFRCVASSGMPGPGFVHEDVILTHLGGVFATVGSTSTDEQPARNCLRVASSAMPNAAPVVYRNIGAGVPVSVNSFEFPGFLKTAMLSVATPPATAGY